MAANTIRTLSTTRPRSAQVSMVFHQPTTFLMRVPDAFKFKPKGWLTLLQKAAWVFLRRSRALHQYADEQAYYTRITFDADSALARIMLAREELFRGRGSPSRVLIGAEDFAEIMRDQSLAGPLVRQYEFTGQAGYEGHVFGLPVEVIPHMRGVLVL